MTSRKNSNIFSTAGMALGRANPWALLVALGMVALPVQASDLEIYAGASAGKPTITLMLDTSGSMTSVDNPAEANPNPLYGSSCDFIDRNGSSEITPEYPFARPYCKFNETGEEKIYSRLSYLKMGLMDLVTSPELLNNVYIGIGHFPNHKSGSIDIPVKLLDAAHRDDIINYIKNMGRGGNTPIAQAYAEVGAYMLGQTTTPAKHSYLGPLGLIRWTIDYTEYTGFRNSASATKINNKYNSPVEAANTCAGNGIYFLTDGYPNSSNNNIAKTIMERALLPVDYNTPIGDNTPNLSVQCDFNSNRKYADTHGWSCIHAFANNLKNENNPKKTKIITATVGFGGAFKGSVNTESEAECVGNNLHIKNTCKWGARGGGGFYYGEKSEDVVRSVKSLIGKLNTEIDPVSTGTMSLPLDSLGGFKSRKFAYLPILEPKPGQAALWQGNLKKYQVANATLTGVNDKLVFRNILGQFADNTWDSWNRIKDPARSNPDAKGNVTDAIPDDAQRPDKGLPQVGGAYQQIFENRSNSRNLFVNEAGELKNPQVDISNKLLNFDSLSSYQPEQKRILLKFMGFDEPSSTPLTDGSVLTASKDKWLKNHGGVLHSVPQLITTKVDIDSQGKFVDDSRKDYLLYGSMDGALHMIDDSTGQEVFTFVPKQVLDLQPDALTDNGTTVSGGQPYGVDAPWLTYVSYSTQSKTVGSGDSAVTTNTYAADKSLAMGGLRMGGSSYYALDISNVTSPALIYSVGSNYANRLQGSTDKLQGMKNDVFSTTNAQQLAFARMGQTWAQPTIGYVRSGGKRIMVNFLPGGYDSCYEMPDFRLNSSVAERPECSGKSAAQGNAMYMVQVGEESTRSNNETYFDTSTSDSGKLLWWASNQGNGSDATRRSTGLQYSNQADLKHSIVTQVRALDRNYDGYTDHIYFADLGGQLWRVDINNNQQTDSFKIDRVVKILDVSDQVKGNDAPPRFYERPLVTFYNGNYAYADSTGSKGVYNGVMAMITVGTGDRSSPVSATRNLPNAIYSIIDKDVTRQDLFAYGSTTAKPPLRTPLIPADKLAKLSFTDEDAAIVTKMRSNAVQGWYMPLTHWDNEGEVVDAKTASNTYKLKMFNEPDALAGVLLLSTYNPDAGNTAGDCSAGVKGSTQRERTCMPYGVCLDNKGAAVATPRAIKLAGVGIVDNFITQFNNSSLFTSLKNYCQGDECQPKLICPDGNCKVKLAPDCQGPDCDDSEAAICSGPGCGADASINTDKRINPLSWMEH